MTQRSPTGPSIIQRLRAMALDITPLRESRDFRFLLGGQAINLIGNQVRMVTVPYLVFVITNHSSLAVGLVSMAQFVPAIFVSILGGNLADILDRRRLLMATQALLLLTSSLLTMAAFLGTPRLWFIFAVVAVAGAINAIDQPTRRAAIARMIRREQIINALALNQTVNQLGSVAGPSLAGIALASFGVGPAFLIDSVTFLFSLASVACLSPIPAAETSAARGPWLSSVREGLAFVWRRPVIGSTFLVDINATFFGGPRALFPALALDVFKVGRSGLGLLYATPGVGALAAVLMSGWVGRVRYQGRAIVICALIWGLAISAFGLMSRFFLLALLLLAIAFAADATSAIFRSTILQLAVPDRLRGRLSAIHFLAVGTGPQLGNVESGAVAQVAGTEFSVVSGGIAAAAGVAIIAVAIPAFIRYDASREDPEVMAESTPPSAG